MQCVKRMTVLLGLAALLLGLAGCGKGVTVWRADGEVAARPTMPAEGTS